LNSANAWRLYCKSGRRPSDIPTCPNTQYANDGWTSWADWLGTTTIATNQREYRSFNDARGGPTPNQEKSQRIFRLVQVQGIIGPARDIPFSLTDNANEAQELLGFNIGVVVRGEIGDDFAIASGGFVFIGTDNAGEDEFGALLDTSIPDNPKRYAISGLYVTGEATPQALRFAARNAARSASAMRTRRPSRCTGRARDSMRRRTVRGDTFKSSAASSMVRSLLTGRPRTPVPVVREAAVEAGLRGGLEVR
jgi:hypothetical protein